MTIFKTMASKAVLVGWGMSIFVAPASAQQMNSDQVLSLVVSNKGMTRVSVGDDEIREMFFYPDNLQDHVTLHKSGHLFIAGEGLERTLFITLMTSKGEVQDLKVESRSVAVKPIMLESTKIPKIPKVEIQSAQAWLEDFARGFIPAGFQREFVAATDRVTDNTTAVATESFANESHEVTIYAAKNKSDQDVQIDSHNFSRPGEGVYIVKKLLSPNESTKVVTIRKKGKSI